MHDASDDLPPARPSEPDAHPQEDKVGYGNPPKASRFSKGQSGNPSGRPKRPIGTSIKEIFDGDQMGKNGKLISKREALVVRMMNDAVAGNQKAFGRFLRLLNLSGLKRIEQISSPTHVFFEPKQMTPEEYEEWKRNFGRPFDEPKK